MRWSRGWKWVTAGAAALGLAGCVSGEMAPAPQGAPAVKQEAALEVQWSPFFQGEPGANVQWLEFPAQNNKANSAWAPIMTDVIQHLPLSYGNTYYDSDKITYTHETTHGINSHLRNNFNDTGSRANGFYVPGNRAAIVVEPNMRKSDANAYVPQSLRGSRYSLYMAGSQAWDDTPLYIFDEWIAYINGGDAGVELVQQGLWSAGWRDGVAGQLEFTVYALALAMAARDRDPAYFESNVQFREFLAFNVKRSMSSFRVGAELSQFTWDTQDIYYETFKNDPSAEPMRAFCREFFGEGWANAVIFGDGVLPENNDPVDPIDDPNDDPVDPIDDPVDPNDDPVDPNDDPVDPNDDPVDPNDDPDDPFDNPNDPIDDPNDPIDDPGDAPIDPQSDVDTDGIADADDLCKRTPAGRVVWRTGEWMGCAGGEVRDRLPRVDGLDTDVDGVGDDKDLCSSTPSGAMVWARGAWMGCAEGQFRDLPRLEGPDADVDGIPDAQDLCSGTPARARVWTDGSWMGCAEGQYRD